jgi:hypothetical protein
MNKITVKGIEIIDDESVPEGQVWINVPMPEGGKIRYMFTLTDHSFARMDGNPSFFKHLQDALIEIRQDIPPSAESVYDRLSQMIDEMTMFQRGKWPPHHEDAFEDPLPIG